MLNMSMLATRENPGPRYTSPDTEVLNPYWPSNTLVNVVNSRYITPNTKAT